MELSGGSNCLVRHLESGLAEAERTGKPILLISAAPQCHNVPGGVVTGQDQHGQEFLADQDVIAASRKFVCIRLATYENADENEVLKGVFAPGGVLQNTVFP